MKRTEQTQFARFALEGFSLKGRMLSDNSMVTSVLLLKCILDDIRPDRQNKLNRIIDKSPEKFENASDAKSMIDITYQQKNDDSFGKYHFSNEKLSQKRLFKLIERTYLNN